MIPAAEDIKIAMNIAKDPESIKFWIENFNNELKDIENNNKNKKNIGDIVYYSVSNTKIIEAQIVNIDEYPSSTGETNYFYWVTPANYMIRWVEHIRYKWSVLINKPYVPNKIFFTNSVQLGKDVFLTEEDAEKAYLLYNAIFYLQELTEYYE